MSDDERREVAERLRSVAREVDRGGFSETIKHVKLAVFEDLDRYQPNCTLDRLADLIEPDTTSDTTRTASDTTRCDREALLALADELSGDTLVVPAVYGTYAGGYVAACQDVARRIRKALGVES